jgi:hypothetical protein
MSQSQQPKVFFWHIPAIVRRIVDGRTAMGPSDNSRPLERQVKQANQHDRAIPSRRVYPSAIEKAPVEAEAKFA